MDQLLERDPRAITSAEAITHLATCPICSRHGEAGPVKPGEWNPNTITSKYVNQPELPGIRTRPPKNRR